MLLANILEVISSRKAYITITLIIFLSLFNNVSYLTSEEYDCSNVLAVSHTAMSAYDSDGNYIVRGIIYIKNLGTSPAYILSIDQLIQSEHAPQWITIKEESLFDGTDSYEAIVVEPNGYHKIIFNTIFVPEVENNSYRDRIDIRVLDPSGTSTKYISDVQYYLPEGPPPTTIPPTTAPPTTQPPTTIPPTTIPPTTQPPTTQPPTTVSPSTLPPVEIGKGTISNIEADICKGGSAVCVELTVTSGSFTQSSLHLVVTSQDELSWDKVYESCMDVNVGGGGLTTDNTPVLFCFEDLSLSGPVDEYDVCVTWKQGLSCKRNAPVISRQCTNCRSIPTFDYLTYGVIVCTLLLVGAFYIRRISHDR